MGLPVPVPQGVERGQVAWEDRLDDQDWLCHPQPRHSIVSWGLISSLVE